jgi:hypothetical protein
MDRLAAWMVSYSSAPQNGESIFPRKLNCQESFDSFAYKITKHITHFALKSFDTFFFKPNQRSAPQNLQKQRFVG